MSTPGRADSYEQRLVLTITTKLCYTEGDVCLLHYPIRLETELLYSHLV